MTGYDRTRRPDLLRTTNHRNRRRRWRRMAVWFRSLVCFRLPNLGDH